MAPLELSPRPAPSLNPGDPASRRAGPSQHPLDAGRTAADHRAARSDLRRQIARLEAELGELFGSAWPREGISFRSPAAGGSGRLLGVGELERVRDSLASRVQQVRRELDRLGEREQAARILIERMVAEPERYPWVRVSNRDLGEPGCRHWHSRPLWGPIGLLLGWWRVRVSSGCPLAEPPAGGGPPGEHRREPGL